MTRTDLMQRLRELRPWLAQAGVSELALFGSFARDAAHEGSDVDLLVAFDEPPGLRFFALERELSQRLGRPVELCTLAAMPSLMRERVLAEAVRV